MYCAWCGTPVTTVSYAPCSRCGRPTNGAQTAPAAGGSSSTLITIVLVVFGGLVAIAIMGILAAIAIPNLLTATQRAKQRRTMADIRTLGTAVEAYSSDNNGYPDTTSIEALRPMLSPKYIAAMPQKDGWEHPLMYFCYDHKEGRCTGYVVGSGGKDGMFEHSDPRAYVDSPPGAKTDFSADLIFANGQFIEYPEGIQH
jgi:competence protein ComGC